jgi:pimeloyl-ACP methyl ester carboxylesterase
VLPCPRAEAPVEGLDEPPSIRPAHDSRDRAVRLRFVDHQPQPLCRPDRHSQPGRSLGGAPLKVCTTAGWLCGVSPVKEDRRDAASRTIDLKVVVIPAVAAEPEPDPVFALAGGPGGAATDSFSWMPEVFSDLHATRDIVLIDQRGTGGSNPVEYSANVGPEVAFYTTSVAMDDVDDVRIALGYDMIDLYGPSYGATAAQYYMRQHPEHVRSAVLDGATLLNYPILEHWATSSQAALDKLFSRCEADAACSTAFPKLRQEFDAVLAAARTEPIDTGVTDPDTGDPVLMDAATLERAVHSALVGSDKSAYLPLLIHEAYLGDWASVIATAQQIGGDSTGSNLAMPVVIRCSEAWANYDPEQVAKLGAGSYDVEDQIASAQTWATTCASTPKGVVPANDSDPVRSDIPVLFTVGDSDPQDPPPNIAEAAVDLPNSLTVVVPGQGHTVAQMGCMPSIVTAFISAGTADGLDTSCVDKGGVPVPPFVLK